MLPIEVKADFLKKFNDLMLEYDKSGVYYDCSGHIAGFRLNGVKISSQEIIDNVFTPKE